MVSAMSFLKGVVLFRGGKERFHTLYLKFHPDTGGKPSYHILHRDGNILFGI